VIIPLTFIPEDKLFIFRCLVRVPHFHEVFGNVRFIYDTGSSGSFIGQEDADRIRIPINSLEKDKEQIGRGLAGGAIILYKLPEITLSFIDPKTKQIQRIQCKNFHVGKCASNKPEMRIRDSIIGNNFLVEHKLKLVANPHSDSYMESV
jgi:hypothetical protein